MGFHCRAAYMHDNVLSELGDMLLAATNEVHCGV